MLPGRNGGRDLYTWTVSHHEVKVLFTIRKKTLAG